MSNEFNRGLSRPAGLSVLASAISGILSTGGMSLAHAQQDQLEEVTVTGSRIVRRDLTAPSPIMTIETEQIENSSTIGLESVLNQMPQFVPADTQFDSSIESTAVSSPGIASLNLRGLGPNRNLVLVDGRRAQPANATLVVDVNTIPSAAIGRVETITGGASAVYGADALAGVVNFILKDDFEGIELDMQTGMTAEGDGAESRFSSLIGMNTEDGRGNLMLGVEWAKREQVLQIDREFYRAGWTDPGTQAGGFINAPAFAAAYGGVENLPSQAAVDAMFPDQPAGSISPATEFYFNADGTPFIVREGIGYNGDFHDFTVDGRGYTGMKIQPNGNLGQAFVEGLVSSPMERRSAFGRAIYDIADNVSGFVQANYSSVEVEQRGGYPPAITTWSAPIPNDGERDIPDALQTLLDSRPNPEEPWTLFRVLDFLGGPVNPINTTDVYQIMAGVEGTFPNRDWTWEAYASTGETHVLSVTRNLGSLQRYQYLVEKPGFGTGEYSAGRNYSMNCPTGLPIFDPPPVADSCLEAITAPMRVLTDLSQDIVEANMQGALAEMPAGELRFAAGVSNRKNSFLYEPGLINDDVSVIENPIGLFAANNTRGETEVAEIYGELLVPATERLEFELGYRYSDYDTAGGVDTYKALFNWSTTDAVSLRGGYQLATRAPNTAELFTGPTLDVVFFPPSDPCSYTTTADWGNVERNPRRDEVQDLCRALIGNSTSAFDTNPDGPDGFARPGAPFFPLEIEIVQGNPDLGPEEAKTWTFGFVLNGPLNFENLTASFDFYNIEISDAIAPLDSLFVYEQCFNADGESNPELTINDPGGWCSMIRRNPITGERQEVDAPFFNSGILETGGLDVTLNWTADLGGNASMYVNSVISLLDRFETQESAGAPVQDAKGTLAEGGQFDYRLFTTLGFNFGRANVGLTWRHLPSVEDEAVVTNPSTTVLGVGSYDLFNMFAGYSITDRIRFRGGIDNLLDKEPPVVGANPGVDNNLGTTRPDYYDTLGRRAYVGVQMGF